MANAAHPGAVDGDPPYTIALVSAAAEFNANVCVGGVALDTKKALVMGALTALAEQLRDLVKREAMESAVVVELLQAVYRLLPSAHGYQRAVSTAELPWTLEHLLAHPAQVGGLVGWLVGWLGGWVVGW
jgi:hypothetical protein